MGASEFDRPHYYFALPRLFARLRGRNSHRTEMNWLEANIAGAAVILISFLAIARWLLADLARWKQTLLLLPAVLATWMFWILVLYIDAQIIKLLRALGMLSALSDARAQSVLICTVTTALTCVLLHAGPLLHAVGAIWICLVCLNLVAAVLLAAGQRRT